jgi:hypothetical protein
LDNLLTINEIILYKYCKNNEFKPNLREHYIEIKAKLKDVKAFEENAIQTVDRK